MSQYTHFIKAKGLDKRMIMAYLQGEDPRRKHPFYYAPLVPTFAGALDIFQLRKLEKIKVRTKQYFNGNFTLSLRHMGYIQTVERSRVFGT
jgi:hypothetical protein